MKSEEIPNRETAETSGSAHVDAEYVRQRIIGRVEDLDNERDRLLREHTRSVAEGNIARARAYELAISSQGKERADLSIALTQLSLNPQDARKLLDEIDGRPSQPLEESGFAIEDKFFQPLRFSGRNKRGVPIYEGDTSSPSVLACLQLVIGGIVVCAFGLMLFGLSYHSVPFHPDQFISLSIAGFGLIITWRGLSGFVKRKRLALGVPVDTLSAELGTPELTLLIEAREHGVEPRSIINGKEIFRLSDLGDAGILLRPAEPPAGAETRLLRPAAQGKTKPEMLLHTADFPASRDNDRK